MGEGRTKLTHLKRNGSMRKRKRTFWELPEPKRRPQTENGDRADVGILRCGRPRMGTETAGRRPSMQPGRHSRVQAQ